jgi:ABC-2 type transport system ATP-binding protein
VTGERLIRTYGLTKEFRGRLAVDALDIEVERGEVYGFLGPNGAGKTTTIRMLMGLLRPSAGRAEIFGLDAWRDRVTIHRRTGNLPGDFAFDQTLTGREAVSLFARLRGLDLYEQSRRLAERFEADLDRPLKLLSTGNRQKIGLILTFAHEPELVILDEPTAGLDPLMQEEFLALVEEQRTAGTTIFLSSHNLAEVERCCDRVALIREGGLIAVDRVDALRHGFVHSVRFEFDRSPEPEAFAGLPNTRVRATSGNVIELDAAATDIDELMRIAARWRIVDMTCSEPSLEQAFVSLYRDHDIDAPLTAERADA